METLTTAPPADVILSVFMDINLSDPRQNVTRVNGGEGNVTENIFQYLEAMTTPLVCLVGTILNLLTVGAFLSARLRNISCSLYLAVRSLGVFGFLVSMFIAWSNTFMPLVQTEGICQLTVFLSYFCPFVSVWMVVIISVENFIRISQPSRVGRLCTPRVAKIVIMIILLVGLLVYNFPLWAIGVVDGKCIERPSLIETVLILNNLDTVLTLLCPLGLMIVVVPLVALSAIHAYERKKRLSGDSGLRNRQSSDSKSSPEARVTHLLLAVSVVFLLFHTPFHAIRIKLFILRLTKQEPNRLDQGIHHVFRLIFNFDTIFSCAIYLVFGDNFRSVFCDLYFSRCMNRKSSELTSAMTAARTAAPSHGTTHSDVNGPSSNVLEMRHVAAHDRLETEDSDDDEARTRASLLTTESV
ncbi:unnamed protein product [Lymnaea stagnalis]|uniref:G-protein coupled receptors family 1 profile domain-containing protein n=1 Tax=Lymnaea stagnalis TaxID=6523 RepID=A0AAV2HFR3_LYMST